VIEIQGPASSGKTHLLYHLIITCITPLARPPITLGGWGQAAVVFDTDGTFNVHRLQQLLVSRLSRLASRSGDTLLEASEIEEIAMRALGKLHIFHPTSSIQLAATLLHLPAFHASNLRDSDIGLLAIDSISSFHWPDRFTVEQMRVAPNSTAGAHVNFVSPLQHVLTAVQKFRLSHGPVVVFTNWGLNTLPNDSLYKQHLQPFPVILDNLQNNDVPTPEVAVKDCSSSSGNAHGILPLTHHITLPFIPFTQIQFPETQTQEETPRELLETDEVVGVVRTAGSSKVGRFVFQIGAAEVLIGDDDPGSATISD
jgi:DNA-repair protein XRCC2